MSALTYNCECGVDMTDGYNRYPDGACRWCPRPPTSLEHLAHLASLNTSSSLRRLTDADDVLAAEIRRALDLLDDEVTP